MHLPVEDQLGKLNIRNPAYLPHGLLVTLGRPRRLLLLAGQDRPVDGHVLERLALFARVRDLGLGDDPGGNCIKIGLPGKSILRDHFQ